MGCNERIKVKICGITNLGDAIAAIGAGCNALGFVFYKKSPRYITPLHTKKIIRLIPSRILKIGVFVNAKEKTIKNIAKTCRLDMLQFHGNESAQFCNKFKGYRIIKAFRVKDKLDLRAISGYRTFAYLFDTFEKTKIGGTGKKFNWNLLASRDKIKRTLFLSGGLNKNNVKEAIKTVCPNWLDVSSSVEIRPGKKDYKKIKEFIEVVRK
jgi:phosphoribosylanthranilate isomerase